MGENQELVRRPVEPRNGDNYVELADASLYNYDLDAESDGGTRFSDYLSAVRKHLLLIIGITILVTLAAAVYMARQPDIYQARARVQVNLESNPALGESRNGAVIINNPTGDPAYFNTQLMILSGPSLLQRVVRTLDLENNPEFLNPPSTRNISTWKSLQRLVGREPVKVNLKQGPLKIPAVSPPSATAQEDMRDAQRLAPYVGAIQNGLEVKLVESTRLIVIVFRHPNPEIAASVVNAIADTYAMTNLEKKIETNANAGEFIQKRIAELQDQIRSGEEHLIEYGKNNEILSLDPSQDTVVARLTDLNRQLLQAENQRKLAESAYNTAMAPGAADVLAEGTNPRTAFAEGQLASLRLRRAQLLIEAGEEWPEVKEIDKQIAEVEKDIADSRQKAKSLVVAKLDTAYRQAQAAERTIREAFEKQREQTITFNGAAINYRMIQQEVATNKSLLDGLLKRSKENDVILAGTPNNISVLDYAIVPNQPVEPHRLQVVGLALLFSVAFGLGTSVLLEQFGSVKPIRSASQVERLLHLNTLAAIPSAKRLVGGRKLHALKTLATNGNGDRSPSLLLNADVRSPLAEAYGMLRTSLLLSAQNAPKTLLVTSSLPGEGKTTTAINTALVLARTGARVLIIDADMRHPQLHTIFKIENNRGVSTILANEISNGEISAMIEQDEATGLYLLPSGPVPLNPSELLSSKNLTRLFDDLETSFSYIIIDSPPVAYFTDGVLLSSAVKGVLLVVHGHLSSKEIVQDTQRLLAGVGARILGVILNHVAPPRHEYHYYKSYYHGLSSQ